MVFGSGGPVRALRRLSILVDVEDVATARLAAINGAASKAQNSLEGAEQSARGVSAAFKGVAIAAGVGVMAVRSITRVGAQLDTTFATIQETSKATGEEMSAITDKVSEIGREMPIALRDVTDAFKEFSYAGFSAQESVEAARATTELAVAGQMKMAEATKMTGQMMNAFGVESDAISATVGSMTAVFSNSAVELRELGNSMRYFSSTANQLGFDLTEVNAALGTLANFGLEGSMAGTAMNQAWNKFLKQSGSVEQALSYLNLSMEDFTDQEGNMLPMIDVLEKMKERLDEANVSGAGLNRWLIDMFGQRGARAMGPILKNLDEFEEQLETGALGQIKATFQAWDDLSKRDIAEMKIIWNQEGKDPASVRADLEEMEDEEIFQLAETMGDVPDKPMDAIAELQERYEDGTMSVEQMIAMLEEVFDIERQAARHIVDMIRDDDVGLKEISKRLDEVTTQGELTEAQMDTVGGRLRYVRSSFETLAWQLYEGFKPALEVVLDLFIQMLDTFNENETALKAFGAALFTLTSVLVAYTVIAGGTIAINYANAAATSLWAASSWSLHAALGSGLVGSVAALAAASKGLIGHLLLVAKAKWTVTAAAIAMGNYSFAASTAIGGLAYVAGMAVGALKALAAGAYASLAAMGPLGWAMMAIIAILVAMKLNLFGVADAFEWVKTAIGDLVGAFSDMLAWFREIPLLIKLIIIGLVALVNPLAAVGAALLMFNGVAGEAVGGVVGVFVWLWEVVVWIHDGIVAIFSAIGDVIYFVAGRISEAIRGAAGWLMELFEILDSIDSVSDLRELEEHLAAGMVGVADAMGDFAKFFAMGLWNMIVGGFKLLEKWIGSEIKTLIEDPSESILVGLIDGVANAVKKAPWLLVKIIAAVIILTFGLLITAAGGIALAIYRFGKWVVDTIVDAITEWVPKLVKAGFNLVAALALGILTAPFRLGEILAKKLAEMLPFLPGSDAERGPLANLTQRGAAIVGAIAKGIKNAPMSGAKGALKGKLSKVRNSIGGKNKVTIGIGTGDADETNKLAKALRSVRDVFEDMVDLTSDFHDEMEPVRELLDAVVELLEDFDSGFFGIERIIGGLDNLTLGGIVGGISDAVQGAVGGAGEWVGEKAGEAEDFIEDTTDRIFEGATDVPEDARGEVKEYLRDFVSGMDPEEIESNSRELARRAVEGLSEEFAGIEEDGSLVNGINSVFERAEEFMPGSDARRGPLSNLSTWGQMIPFTLAKALRDNAGVLMNEAQAMMSGVEKMMSVQPTVGVGAEGLSGRRLGEAVGGTSSKTVALDKDDVNYVDDRTLVIEQSPKIDISGGTGAARANISEQIERAMEQTREATMDDFIDFMLVGGPAELFGQTGEETTTDDGEEEDRTPTEDDFDDDELPEDWDEMSDEEKDEWLEENEPEDWGEDEEDGEDGTDSEDGEDSDDGDDGEDDGGDDGNGDDTEE